MQTGVQRGLGHCPLDFVCAICKLCSQNGLVMWRSPALPGADDKAGMRISTSKSKAMVCSQKMMDCSLWVGSEVLPRVEKFKYHCVLFTSEQRMGREIDWHWADTGSLTAWQSSLLIGQSKFLPKLRSQTLGKFQNNKIKGKPVQNSFL